MHGRMWLRFSPARKAASSPRYPAQNAVYGAYTESTMRRTTSSTSISSSLMAAPYPRTVAPMGDDLDGFRPTGQILVDGVPVSIEGLEALIRALLAGEISVHSITVR